MKTAEIQAAADRFYEIIRDTDTIAPWLNYVFERIDAEIGEPMLIAIRDEIDARLESGRW